MNHDTLRYPIPEAHAKNLPRIRFTVRRMMIGVAVMAVLILAVDRLLRLSIAHTEKAGRYREDTILAIQGYPGGTPDQIRRQDHFSRLADKYEHAARYPWLPVEPDPPEPE